MANNIEREGPTGWTAGPYVRVGEREAWNEAYFIAESEVKIGRNSGYLPDFTDAQIHTLAWNVAYRTIWHQR